jgi:hypothetical protein
VTSQELAETIVKLFSANPDVLHIIVDILSENNITEKELFVRKVLDAPASTTHQELEELIKKMAEEHHLRSPRK